MGTEVITGPPGKLNVTLVVGMEGAATGAGLLDGDGDLDGGGAVAGGGGGGGGGVVFTGCGHSAGSAGFGMKIVVSSQGQTVAPFS